MQLESNGASIDLPRGDAMLRIVEEGAEDIEKGIEGPGNRNHEEAAPAVLGDANLSVEDRQ